MLTSFLQAILGNDGLKTIKNTIDHFPSITNVIIPRSIVSWVSTASQVSYDGIIPGINNSNISLAKNGGNFDGSISMGDGVYNFDNESVLHIAAALGIALGVKDCKVDPMLKGQDLSKLGKSLDLLIKSQFVKGLEKSVQLWPAFRHRANGKIVESPIAVHVPPEEVENELHNWEDGFVQRPANNFLNRTDAAKLVGRTGRLQSEDLGKEALATGKEGSSTHNFGGGTPDPGYVVASGPAASPAWQFSEKSYESQSEEIRPKRRKSRHEVMMSKNEMSLKCPDCGGKQFNNNKFIGCICTSSFKKNVSVASINDDEFSVHFDNLEDEIVDTLIKMFKNVE